MKNFFGWLFAAIMIVGGITNWYAQPQLTGWDRVLARGTHFHLVNRGWFEPDVFEHSVTPGNKFSGCEWGFMKEEKPEEHVCDGHYVILKSWF